MAQAQRDGQTLNVAVVADGPSDLYRRATRTLKRELQVLLKGRYAKLALPEAPTHVGEFSDASAQRLVREVLADPNIDVVVSLGVRSGRAIGATESLPKPVFLPFAHVEIQGLPRDGAKSGRHNLNYLTGLVDLERDLRRFRDVIRRDRVVLLVDQVLLDAITDLPEYIRQWAQGSMELTTVGTNDSASAILEAIPEGAEAVYLGPLMRLPDSEVDSLLQALNERRLPTYASEGREWVERGAFVSLVPAGEDQRRLRKIALNVDETLTGTDPAEMSTTFERRAELTINMRTARQLQVWPHFELMTEAVLIGASDEESGEVISLRQAVEQALRANLDLSAQREDIELARQQYRSARGEVTPKIDLQSNFDWIPKNVVFPLINSERTIDIGVSGTQMLYSPAVVGGLRSQNTAIEAARAGVRANELDVVVYAAEAYLNVLRTRTAETINRDFLARVRQNLAMAEVRVEIGASGRQDVFRWQTEIADAQVNVLDATAMRNKAEIQLNRILNRPLEAPVQTLDPMEGEGGVMIDARVRELVDDPWSFEVFREFAAGEAVERSPEVTQFATQIKTQEEVLQARRAQLFAPDIFMRGGITRVLHRSGRGAETDEESAALGVTRQDFQWQFGVTAQMRLYDQTRYAEIDRVRAQLVKLRAQRSSTVQGIEQRVRSELLDAGVTSAAMGLRADAADAAKENLELVTDAYRKGTVDVITLIDAQNQALSSELRAANAVYDFLLDFVQAERAMGRFSFLQDEDERQAFVARLTQFYTTRRSETSQSQSGSR